MPARADMRSGDLTARTVHSCLIGGHIYPCWPRLSVTVYKASMGKRHP